MQRNIRLHWFAFSYGAVRLIIMMMLFIIQYKTVQSFSLVMTGLPSSSTQQQRSFQKHKQQPKYKKKHLGKSKHSSHPSSIRSTSTETQIHRLLSADQIERELEQATTLLQSELYKLKIKSSTENTSPRHDPDMPWIPFPSVRNCNAALAIWGDTGDFQRALKLFGLMRKSLQLVTSYYETTLAGHHQEYRLGKDEEKYNDHEQYSLGIVDSWILQPPSPTLVTYSTLMSRAVALGKPTVALRLWRLMILEKQFYCNIPNNDTRSGSSYNPYPNALVFGGPPIVPDIKAVNILMNVFAKMGDSHAARELMEQLNHGKVIPYNEYYQKALDDEPSISITSTSTLPVLRLIQVIPQMEPNIVTYNTLIDAYHREGDLDAGLEVLQQMKQLPHIQPDARTYTSLISTVGRRVTKSSGAKDPDLAFILFDEMVSEARVRPNGMTYSALIDVCGRCRRSDLALKGLRMMIRQKVNQSVENANSKHRHVSSHGGGSNKSNSPEETSNTHELHHHHQVILYNEVGAWTAAIDACGKVGRIETAIRLFHTMQKFGAKPNTVTCGCLTDCLLRSGKMEETLKVLDYMKKEGIQPSEVMYTSLITSASILAKTENALRGELILNEFGDRMKRDEEQNISRIKDNSKSPYAVQNEDEMKALDVYTALIQSLTGSTNKNVIHIYSPMKKDKNKLMTQENLVVRVFLILQEMKASGAEPDIACYNAILRACAGCGDISRIRDVLRRIQRDNLVPNSTTWKEILKGASYAADSVTAEEMWNLALNYKTDTEDSYIVAWTPRIDDFELLLASYSNEAEKASTTDENKIRLYKKIIEFYDNVEQGTTNQFGLLKNIDMMSVHSSRHAVKMIQKAAKYLNYQLFMDRYSKIGE